MEHPLTLALSRQGREDCRAGTSPAPTIHNVEPAKTSTIVGEGPVPSHGGGHAGGEEPRRKGVRE